jgi:hypothetical protein
MDGTPSTSSSLYNLGSRTSEASTRSSTSNIATGGNPSIEAPKSKQMNLQRPGCDIPQPHQRGGTLALHEAAQFPLSRDRDRRARIAPATPLLNKVIEEESPIECQRCGPHPERPPSLGGFAPSANGIVSDNPPGRYKFDPCASATQTLGALYSWPFNASASSSNSSKCTHPN